MKRASKIITPTKMDYSEQHVTMLTNSYGHMKLLKRFTYLFISTLILFSCSGDDDTIVIPLGDYENGILIMTRSPGKKVKKRALNE